MYAVYCDKYKIHNPIIEILYKKSYYPSGLKYVFLLTGANGILTSCLQRESLKMSNGSLNTNSLVTATKKYILFHIPLISFSILYIHRLFCHLYFIF